jgi:hypothetical protein
MSMAGRSRSRRAPSRLGRDAPPAEPAGGVDWAPWLGPWPPCAPGACMSGNAPKLERSRCGSSRSSERLFRRPAAPAEAKGQPSVQIS